MIKKNIRGKWNYLKLDDNGRTVILDLQIPDKYNEDILFTSNISIDPKNTFYILDFETTALMEENSCVIESSLLEVSENFYNKKLVVDELSYHEDYVNTQDIHKISRKDLKGKPRFEEYAKDVLKKYLDDIINDESKYLVSQYCNFELYFIAKYYGQDYADKLRNKTIDTWAIGTFLSPNKSHHLEDLCEQYNVKIDKKKCHRSGYDVLLTANILEQEYIRCIYKLKGI